MNSKIKVIPGDTSIDQRGAVSFVNGFNFKNVKRFYQIENFSLNTVRAFHGHLKEAKYVYPVTGSIILAVAPINNPSSPSKKIKLFKTVLSSRDPKIVYIPPRYANGFKSLENGTKVIFFSTSTLKESLNDDYRYPSDYWGKEIWE